MPLKEGAVWPPIISRVPSGSSASPEGKVSTAAVPAPSGNTAPAPVPARVITAPEGRMARILWLKKSLTNITPPAIPPGAATAYGALKALALPCPSAKLAEPSPATVHTKPVERLIARILCDAVSATRSAQSAPHTVLESAGTASPYILLKRASLGRPSAQPTTPAPAIVRTTPPGTGADLIK